MVIQTAGQRELGLNSLNSVSRVNILDKNNLEARGRALSGSNGRRGKEVFPDLNNGSVSTK